MQPINKLIAVIALAVLMQSCTQDKPGWWKNDQIPSGKREDFHQRNKVALTCLKDDNYKFLKTLVSRELMTSTYTIRQAESISNRLVANDYTLFDEYYIVNKWKSADTVINKAVNENSYNLYYKGVAREMYMAFFLPKTGDNKWMITIVYAKLDYGWRITLLDVQPYTINGKTSPQLFDLAKQEAAKKFYANAEINMELADACLRPNDLWQYPNDSLIHTFHTECLVEANQHIKVPLVIDAVPSHPRIFRIVSEKTAQGTYPMIYYQTSVNLNNIDAIKKENEAIKKVIGKVIEGIDKDNDHLLYTAFNKMPNPRESVDRYEMDDKLK